MTRPELLELARRVQADGDSDDIDELARAVIELCEPVKPVDIGVSYYPWSCGSCNSCLIQSGNFCPNCGKALDWSKERV